MEKTMPTRDQSPNANPNRPLPTRREALLSIGIAASAAAAEGAIAGPFEPDEAPISTAPADKKLAPAWVKSLTAKGAPTVYRGAALRYIGMPVGGIGAGQVYLGGDGRLWRWDIFNQHMPTGDAGYARPPQPDYPFEQGFALRVKAGGKEQTLRLDRQGFPDVAFRGEYPIGIVDYAGPGLPVSVRLEAFSPFIPLNADDSALPATVMQYTVRNVTSAPIECDIGGWLENAVCPGSGVPGRTTQATREAGITLIEHSIKLQTAEQPRDPRPEILFDDFEKKTYDGWTATGTAFGSGPVEISKIPEYQGDVAGRGKRVVNSHAAAPGSDVGGKDGAVGTLTSRPFTVERDYIHMLIGGGNHKDRTCVQVLVDGKPVAALTGDANNRMTPKSFDVRAHAGKQAQIRFVDDERGGWGNIGGDHIVFSDVPARPEASLPERPDFGTMALALAAGGGVAAERMPDGEPAQALFAASDTGRDARATEEALATKPVGGVRKTLRLAPGKSATVSFVLAWHFPNLDLSPLPRGRHYAVKFGSAGAVARYVASNLPRLARETRLWRDTWYRSSLPVWFLDRTFANASTMATSTSYWLRNGRFYGWEGVGCCAGTCAHVWHYAQSVARLFPQLERAARDMGDYGAGFEPATGWINFRGECMRYWAADAQAGCILRAYREHQMSADDLWLRKLWPRVRKSLEFLISRDADGDGILDGPQHNTLDADWHGQVAWLSGLYMAALRAGQEMAREMGDPDFAVRCGGLYDAGRKTIDAKLFDGEYYLHIGDPAHTEAIGSYDGCEIDQVLGDSWSHQLALGPVLDPGHVRSALKALWRYNFAPDVGPYRKAHAPGRWYAMPGERGLLMCSWPKGEARRQSKGFDFYFNECMNGFEYQAAGHMLADGMVTEGLAVTRMIHDRYHASRRNPYNEVECGDHYARSMASHGVYLTACGFEYHGPKGHMGFTPRLSPERFEAAWTGAEGWGSYSQKAAGATLKASLVTRWGSLRLRTLALGSLAGSPGKRVTATAAGAPLACRVATKQGRAIITFTRDVVLKAGQTLEVTLA
jgi:uncharacterized protein (DUF608 family)